MENEIQLRLKWRQTWSDHEQDFVAVAPNYEGTVGRIYESAKPGSLETDWFWAMNAFGPEISRNIGPLSGHEPTAREAAKKVEDAWFAAICGSSLNVPITMSKPKNAYQAAKAGE